MQISHSFNAEARTVLFHIHSHSNSTNHARHTHVFRTPRKCATLTETNFRILLPDGISSFTEVHNDTWALVVLLAVFPFVRDELRLSFPVSSAFALTYSELTGKSIVPVDPKLVSKAQSQSQSHHPTKQQRPNQSHGQHSSVAFSGRMHSFATAVSLGPSARLVAVDHWDSMLGERTSVYPVDTMYYALDNMESKGYQVCMLKTDMQSLYQPYGFLHPISAIVGNVLLADLLQLSSVHMGCRLDDLAAYGAYQTQAQAPRTKRHTQQQRGVTAAGTTSRKRCVSVDTSLSVPSRCVSFRDNQLYVDRQQQQPVELTVPFWRKLLAEVGLLLDFPLCGVTDALLVKLLQEHRVWSDANYCLFARPRKRCGECSECAYFDMLHESVRGDHSVSCTKVWQMFGEKYPEALTSLTDIGTPCRWNLFWLELIRRPDTVPDAKNFDVLSAYQPAYQQRRFVVNSMLHIVDPRHYGQVRSGLERLMGVLTPAPAPERRRQQGQ